jgi:hypothetical protein
MYQTKTFGHKCPTPQILKFVSQKEMTGGKKLSNLVSAKAGVNKFGKYLRVRRSSSFGHSASLLFGFGGWSVIDVEEVCLFEFCGGFWGLGEMWINLREILKMEKIGKSVKF